MDVDSDRGEGEDSVTGGGGGAEQLRSLAHPHSRARRRRAANTSDQRVGGSDSETSETAGHGEFDLTTAAPTDRTSGRVESVKMDRAFDSGVSVSVNGVPWTHVVLADRGGDEAVIVVYGLLPNREYDIDLAVGGKSQLEPANAPPDALEGEYMVAPMEPPR